MLVVTNLVLPCVTLGNKQCYDTTHQRFHFARGLLDFWTLVVTNFGRSTDDNVNLRKLETSSETAYLSHSWSIARSASNRADSGAQTPPGRGYFVGNSFGSHSPMQKAPKTAFRSKKRGAKNA